MWLRRLMPILVIVAAVVWIAVGQSVTTNGVPNQQTSAVTTGDGVFDATSPTAGALVANTQNANCVFSGPTSGGAATPSCRSLVTADLGSLLSGYAPLASPALTGTPTSTTPNLGTSSTQIATAAVVSGQAQVITSNFTNSTGSVTTVMTMPSSGSIAAGATFAGRCSGSYQIATGTTTAVFQLTPSQTVQNGSVDAFIGYNGTTSSGGYVVNKGYSATITDTAIAVTATNYPFSLDFGGTWNASTAGTITLQATSGSSSDQITINAGARCEIH